MDWIDKGYSYAILITDLTNSYEGHQTVPLLASDIARRVRRGKHEDLVRVLNRIRNWTKFGLLKPVGEIHPGGGRACQYSEGALLDAMIIQELVNAGLSAVSEVGQVLELIKSKVPRLFTSSFAKRESDQTLLILGKVYSGSNVTNVWLRSPAGFAELHAKRLCSLYYVIDLEKIRERLNAEPEGEGE